MTKTGQHDILDPVQMFWASMLIFQVHRLPLDIAWFSQQLPTPCSVHAWLRQLVRMGFRPKTLRELPPEASGRFPLFLTVRREAVEAHFGPVVWDREGTQRGTVDVAVALGMEDGKLLIQVSGREGLLALDAAQRTAIVGDLLVALDRRVEGLADEDAPKPDGFSFRWILRNLLSHRSAWRDVLLASLVIQTIALATPLCTQVVVDKVIVHQTQSTLIVIAAALAVFLIFTAVLTWGRQYLILFVGNRVDALLGQDLIRHLLRLPLRYFEHRPTGVIAARLHGIEEVREFVSSSIVTLVLDLPFLLIFVAVMVTYSVPLTAVVVTLLLVIAVMSLLVAPRLRERLNQQFLLGARNQAFLTEHIAAMETVKSLQLEPQLNQRWRGLLADHIEAGFRTRQMSNTFNVIANGLDQLSTLLVLVFGAWLVMNSDSTRPGAMTIGMLVAFQMFASRLSQPVMRLVGLWQQFQQASIAVRRLADVLDAEPEPSATLPQRPDGGQGEVRVDRLTFRHAAGRSPVLDGLSLVFPPCSTTVVMGPSGCGKSTLAKLLLAFYPAEDGRILVDGVDTRQMPPEALRQRFGVVPQETTLFSGTLYENLALARPGVSFEEIVMVCQGVEIHDAIMAMPEGYQTHVGERGVGLSGGQRQRIAIARALLKRPDILIFDEATSALDSQTAEHLARTINALRGRMTVIFIAHQVPRGLEVDHTITLRVPTPGAGAPAFSPTPSSTATPASAVSAAHTVRPAAVGSPFLVRKPREASDHVVDSPDLSKEQS